MTEWVKVKDNKIEGPNWIKIVFICEKCLENYSDTLYTDIEGYAKGCVYNSELYTCPTCGQTRPADQKYDKINENGSISIICDKCIDSKKKKWSPGCLIFLLCIAGIFTYMYLIYY